MAVHFIVHPEPETTNDQHLVSKRLSAIAEKLHCTDSMYAMPAPLLPIAKQSIRQLAIGPGHLAFLLADGNVARIEINVSEEKPESKSTAVSAGGGGKTKLSSSAPAPIGSSTGGSGGSSSTGANSNSTSSHRAKIRRLAVYSSRAARGGASRLIAGARAAQLIPASEVPEDLIAQAQVVLQGKTRDVIVRELQRTHLDVNQAVNNLLSRDDDDGDEHYDESYLPVSFAEEMVNLLDAGLSGEHPSVIIDADSLYAEEVFEVSGLRRKLQERAALTEKAETEANRTAAAGAGTASSSAAASQKLPNLPISLGSRLVLWNASWSSDTKIVQIGALHTELVAIDTRGRLLRWRWDDSVPPNEKASLHWRSNNLALDDEKITYLATSSVRATVVTASNKVASFIDEALGAEVCACLDVNAAEISPSESGTVKAAYASPLFSAVRTTNDDVFWWGVLPYHQRKRVWEKAKSRVKKHVTFDSNDISVGSKVRLRSNPLYQAGSVGFSVINGKPQVGVLMESAWTMTETCRFRIRSSVDLKRSFVCDETALDVETFVEEKPPATSAENNNGAAARSASIVISSPATIGSAPATGFYNELRRRMKRPASSTTSDLFDSPSKSGPREEAWCLSDVVFIEDAKPLACGEVITVDGAYCAVVFPDADGAVPTDSDSRMRKCRLLRKDELQAFRAGQTPRQPECIQREPQRLALRNRSQNIEAMAVDSIGIQLLVAKNSSQLYMQRRSLTGRVIEDHRLPTTVSAFRGTDAAAPAMINYGEDSILPLVMDGNACLYPIVRDCTGSLGAALPVTLPSLSAAAIGVLPSVGGGESSSRKSKVPRPDRYIVMALAISGSQLLRHVLNCDVTYVKHFLSILESEKNLDKAHAEIVNGRTDFNRNILHACIAMCVPQRNKDNVDSGTPVAQSDAAGKDATPSSRFNDWSRVLIDSALDLDRSGPGRPDGLSVSDLIQMSVSSRMQPIDAAASGEAKDESTNTAEDENTVEKVEAITEYPMEKEADAEMKKDVDSELDETSMDIALPPTPSAVVDPKQRQTNALEILRHLCKSPFMTSYLLELLSARDSNGYTPFMLAVRSRAYTAALTIFESAHSLARATSADADSTLLSMLWSGTPDDNPLFLLVYNDTCSFTWTGNEHINQDIFECKTCGLTGTLCCCTECASVCHKGHECKLKRTSPTAYCDCWEKCPCKALIAGNQTARFDIFQRLLTHTNLVTEHNGSNEHILLFLARTVGRQMSEQRQYRVRSKKAAADAGSADETPEMPEHDLDPPRFARRALERLLNEWAAVYSLTMSGCVDDAKKEQLVTEEEFWLNTQNSSTHLDRFLHIMITKCAEGMLDTLLSTIIYNLQSNQPPPRLNQGTELTTRIVRSLCRLYVAHIVGVGAANGNGGAVTKKKSAAQNTAIRRIRHVFHALVCASITELLGTADALMAPVRLGLLKPSLPFSHAAPQSLGSATDVVEQAITIEPPSRRADDKVEEVASVTEKGGSGSDSDESSDDEDGGGGGAATGGGSGSGIGINRSNRQRHPATNRDASGTSQAARNTSAFRSSLRADHLYFSDSGAEQDDVDSAEDSDGGVVGRGSRQRNTSGDSEDQGDVAAGESEDLSQMGSDESEGDHDDEDEDEEIHDDFYNDSEGTVTQEEGEGERSRTAAQGTASGGDASQTATSNTAGRPARWATVTLRNRASDERTVEGERNSRRSAGASSAFDEPAPAATATATSTARRSNTRGASAKEGRDATAPSPDTLASPQHTAVQLCRAFAVIVRQATGLILVARDYDNRAPNLPRLLSVTASQIDAMEDEFMSRLAPIWDWLFQVMDHLESQLRFSAALTSASISPATTETSPRQEGATDAASASAPPPVSVSTNTGSSSIFSSLRSSRGSLVARALIAANADPAPQDTATNQTARRDFLQYALSLLRSHTNEHADNAPTVDLGMFKHTIYVMDALLYVVTNFPKRSVEESQEASSKFNANTSRADLLRDTPWECRMDSDQEELDLSMIAEAVDPEASLNAKRSFFKRSDSICFPGCAAALAQPFTHSASNALPLATQPTLLNADQTATALFAVNEPAQTHKQHDATLHRYGFDARMGLGLGGQSVEDKAADKTPVEPSDFSKEESPSPSQRSRSVIVHSSEAMDVQPPAGVEEIAGLRELRTAMPRRMQRQWIGDKHLILSRWPLSAQAMSKAFADDLANDKHSILICLSGFKVKEQRFRKEMDKLRSQSTSKDLSLDVDRERHVLIQQTVKQLNHFFQRRQGIGSTGAPIAVHKVKVRFTDEPGEGTGVARSFYAAIAEAFLAPERLPNLENCQVGTASMKIQHQLLNRLRTKERERETARRRTAYTGTVGLRRYPLNADAQPFIPAPPPPQQPSEGSEEQQPQEAPDRRTQLGTQLYEKVQKIRPSMPGKITGMLLDLPHHHVESLLESEASLRVHVEEAVDAVLRSRTVGLQDLTVEIDSLGAAPTVSAARPAQPEPANSEAEPGGSRALPRAISVPAMHGMGRPPGTNDPADDAALFFDPTELGFYTPSPGRGTAERLNAFRNVGRLIGICLIQREIFPLPLCRHVLKQLLGRSVTWYDLAFYDSALFESLRSVANSESGEEFETLGLHFEIQLKEEEGGQRVELVPGGAEVPVTRSNVIDYIYQYVYYKLVKVPREPIKQMKLGISDVLGEHSFSNLTSEDLRLLLNGVLHVQVSVLRTYTTFSDESQATEAQLTRFKKWFWSVVEGMNDAQKQDLVYFWTGSPRLPSSEEGFQPLPSIMIRPADDHLPTANTCISRLYVPLYSSKATLKQKLLVAIKARNFGFV